jgi:catechol 2,3-dioxygenase-like lactoylglutathione lyase family enzyme
MLRKLHHLAFRCRDSEQTRRFYEDFLGMPLVGTLEIRETKTGRETRVLHTFYRMEDGSHLAFFEAPDMAFEFKPQHDFDLHVALEVDAAVLEPMRGRAAAAGIEFRGVSDHGFIHSVYLRDPNGYVVELCARMPGHDEAMDPARNGARAILDRWQAARPALAAAASPGPR